MSGTTTPELRQRQPQHITTLLSSLPSPSTPFYTFEVFPPKTSIGTTNLVDRIDRMSRTLDPTWVHVTWGAGGSTQERSLELAGAVQGMGVDCCLHLTCTNMERKVLDGALLVSARFELNRGMRGGEGELTLCTSLESQRVGSGQYSGAERW